MKDKEKKCKVNLQDKDYLNILLILLKDTEKNLSTALTEASNENLYAEYKSMFDGISELQRNAYELMYKFGWYQLEEVEANKVSNLIETLEQDISSLE